MSAVKFTFDDDFNNDVGGDLKKNKLEDIRNEAFEQGLEAGRAEITSSLEQSVEGLLENVLTATQNLHARQEDQVVLMHKESAQLTLAIISKLAPAMVEKNSLPEIEMLVNQCLKNSPLEPRLVIRVDDNILPILQEKLDIMKRANNFFGQIVLLGESMDHTSDCRVEWANGGAQRDYNKLMGDIEHTVKLFIEAPHHIDNNNSSGIDPKSGTISETIVT